MIIYDQQMRQHMYTTQHSTKEKIYEISNLLRQFFSSKNVSKLSSSIIMCRNSIPNYLTITNLHVKSTALLKILIYTLTALNALEAINNVDLYPFYDRETNSFYGKSDGFLPLRRCISLFTQ